jgi:hydroxyethylthiazole kinase-like uncharacterized protein yjeF
MNFAGAAASVLGREAMRDLDARTIAAGTPSRELMERAGLALADFIDDPAACGIAPTAQGPRRLLVLAGRGNNGGDGFVTARLLASRRWRCTVALVGGEPPAGNDAAVNLAEWRRIGGAVVDVAAALRLLRESPHDFDLALDAIYGTGLVRDVEGVDAELMAALHASGLPAVSADLPSGLCADSGRALGVAVRARATLAIGAAKPGLFLGEGPNHAGRVRVADIGLLSLEEAGLEPAGFVLDDATTAACWPRLEPLAHKGSRGHVLVVAGSRGKTGAAVLAARGALRAGAGLVTVASVPDVQNVVSLSLSEAMTRYLLGTAAGDLDPLAVVELREALEETDGVAIGPGLGTGPGADAAVDAVLAAPCPVVLDADALRIVAAWGAGRRRTAFLVRHRAESPPPILTPHPGEMAGLVGRSVTAVQASRAELAVNLAQSLDAVVILKGAATIVTDGRRLAYNLSGNPGMGAAGMGDVLSGVATALAVRLGDPFEAACLAVYAHGLAGDRAGPPGFLAGEVADGLPAALASRRPR